ncbi:unnamed protein product [Ectocarpus sp. 6 AP-2014]
MVSTETIEDPRTIGMLNKIGYRNLGYLGALVQKWENMADEEVSFTEWVLDNGFIESTTKFADAARQQSKVDSGNMKYLKKELEETREELSETKKDVARLVSVNRDLYDKIDKMLHPHAIAVNGIRDTLITFNKENPAAVANGGGVTFGTGHVKINSVDRLEEFLATVHARKLGLPSNILTTLRVFVLEGKLVTLSDDYHGGVGYSFLWKKKNKAKKKKTWGVEGWASDQAKKCDPRLGIDPATGVNYVDPETGKMWIYPDLLKQESGGDSKKRGVSETTPESVAKKMKSGEESEKHGEISNPDDGGGSSVSVSVSVSVSGSEQGQEQEQEQEQVEKEEGEVILP